jgi:hypothetical protein
MTAILVVFFIAQPVHASNFLPAPFPPIHLRVPGNAFQDVWSAFNDPLKLRESSRNISESLERSLNQLRALQHASNDMAQQRLEQIRSIMREFQAQFDQSIDRIARRLLEIENQIYEDSIQLIYRAQCAAEVALMDQFQRGFAQFIMHLREANPSLRIAGYRVISVGINRIEITDPDLAYRVAKNEVEARLRREIRERDNAYQILSAWQNLERSARFARCHYIDQVLAVWFSQEIAELSRRSSPWVTVVRPN